MSQLRQKTYTTADVMKAFNLGRNTLRLYEEVGLLTGMTRTESGYRKYSARQFEDLRFILEAKKVGFTLNEIRDLLEVARSPEKMTCGAVAPEIAGKLDEIDVQLEVLHAKKIFLSAFLVTCSSKSKETKCDIMSAGFSKGACCD
ncbi:MAG: MerR family transcriptional regulator [Bdellovibrionales bacterium]